MVRLDVLRRERAVSSVVSDLGGQAFVAQLELGLAVQIAKLKGDESLARLALHAPQVEESLAAGSISLKTPVTGRTRLSARCIVRR